jgi:anti-anti-sigma regulatory factor
VSEFEASETVVTLPSVLDLNGVVALKASLAELVDTPGAVAIDGSRVERISTPAIQVLLSFAKSTAMRDRAMCLRDPTETVRAAFDDLGLHDQLMQWSAG